MNSNAFLNSSYLFCKTGTALLATTLVFLAGCKRTVITPPPDPTTEAVSAQKSIITASPNPVPAGDGPGKTTISWDTGNGSVVDIYLSVSGADEKLFGKHSKNSVPIDWISAGPVYEFRAYPEGTHDKPIAVVKVTRDKK